MSKPLHFSRRLPGTGAALLLGLAGLTLAGQAQAVPSFARQTGAACTACHTQAFGPNLTPYGRQFKLSGYTWSNGETNIPLSGMIMGSLTNTKKDDYDLATDPGLAKRGFNSNNNLALDEASLFLAGRLAEQIGAFVQFTYDGVEDRLALDNTDLRFAGDGDWLGQKFTYGVSLNNNPTTQDLWNTTPAWGFPYVGSPLARTPSAGPVIASFGGQVGGASLYSMINDLVYLEAGAYTTFAKDAQKSMGNWDPRQINGGAPYWRIALQKNWGGHYFSLGHFGFRADVMPSALHIDPKTTSDRFTDLGLDFNYQYLADTKNIFEFKTSYIREQQELFASYGQLGGADKLNQQLGFLGMNGSYTYDQTYTLSLGFNRTYGNRDWTWNGYSAKGRPGSEFFTAEFDYVPFGKKAGTLDSLMNLRLGVQYVGYTKFDGGNRNYDGASRNASDNNTLYFNTWLSF